MTAEIVQPGKHVALTYRILDDQGVIVEQQDVPLGFVFGSDTQLIGNMDQAVAGKQAGESVEVSVPPEQGFGDHDPNLTFTDDIENVPPQFQQLGAEVQMKNEEGDSKTFYVTRIEDGRVTVDGNHPLAGKTLTFVVSIAEVRDARPGEAQTSGIHADTLAEPVSIN